MEGTNMEFRGFGNQEELMVEAMEGLGSNGRMK
ncbi:hypothetical protein COLO4_31997 [Corchorus olitorius]|uniref:Uncharacterized protein n=1 Tax=Corchorus olitorius TaxID=93759 RepID=A0A1R3GUU5_9ROSI|nr:hypothetical protein COLO4_33303 [Corchorus olitorius]OMO64582.1 hypothetical protein COLO4_31997 [Corchorus olitorius]